MRVSSYMRRAAIIGLARHEDNYRLFEPRGGSCRRRERAAGGERPKTRERVMYGAGFHSFI